MEAMERQNLALLLLGKHVQRAFSLRHQRL
jgi:hypothetical protein